MGTIYATIMSNIFSKTFIGLIGAIIEGIQEERKLIELKKICEEYNRNSRRLLNNAKSLFKERKGYRKDIRTILVVSRKIKNLPNWFVESMNGSMERMEGFEQAIQFEKHPERFAEETDKTGRTAAYMGAGTVTGAAIVAIGPATAMSIATVLGTASTGTAIGNLSEVAATNAALVWLGGGTLAAGGTGMTVGGLVLGMFGPIGAAIADVSAISDFSILRSKNMKMVEEVEKNFDRICHDNLNLAQKIRHLISLKDRSKNNAKKLQESLKWIKDVQPKDYKMWDDDQKHQLEVLANGMFYKLQKLRAAFPLPSRGGAGVGSVTNWQR